MDIMQNMEHKTPLANNHISVDCVVIGFDGEQLKVLLIKRVGEEQGEIFHDMKLPGSLIYMDEDLDEGPERHSLAGTCHAIESGAYRYNCLPVIGEDRPGTESESG